MLGPGAVGPFFFARCHRSRSTFHAWDVLIHSARSSLSVPTYKITPGQGPHVNFPLGSMHFERFLFVSVNRLSQDKMFHDTSLRRTQKCHLSLGKIHAVCLTNLNTVRELRMHEGRNRMTCMKVFRDACAELAKAFVRIQVAVELRILS